MVTKYRQLADELRQAIRSGVYGSKLPRNQDLMAQHGLSKETVSHAIKVLQAEGLVRTVQKAGTFVLDQRTVRVEFSRYASVLEPGSLLGPWETACRRAGIPGEMNLIKVTRTTADDWTADHLEISVGAPVVCRHRHAVIGSGRRRQVVQIHTACYPADIVAGTPIAGTDKVAGGVYAALKAAGIPPVTADETVTARTATAEELAVLDMRDGPVLLVERVTRDVTRRPIEVLRIVADPAHTTLVYDALPLNGNPSADLESD